MLARLLQKGNKLEIENTSTTIGKGNYLINLEPQARCRHAQFEDFEFKLPVSMAVKSTTLIYFSSEHW